MQNTTKLIFLDGVPGTGKSTMAQYLYFQFHKNGYAVRWFHEEELWHPLFYHEKNIQKINCPSELENFMERWPLQWNKLFNFLPQYDLLILTSYLFEDGARVLFANNCSCNQIRKFLQTIVDIISPLNPYLIFLYTSDISKTMLNMWLSRGIQWMRYFYGVDELTPFARALHLNGTSASLTFWSQFQSCCKEVLEDLHIEHLSIDICDGKWALYYKSVIDYLGLKEMETTEIIIGEKAPYCGFYLSVAEDEISCRIRSSADCKLVADFLWPDVDLIPVTKNRFWLRSFPLQLVFEDDNGDHFTKIHLEGIDLYHLTDRIWKRIE